MVFVVPSILFAAIGIVFYFVIRNEPADAGLPPLDPPKGGPEGEPGRRTLTQNVAATLGNPTLWIVATAFFLLDLNRYGFVNWMPAYVDDHAGGSSSPLLTDFKKMMTLGIHPLAGSLGVIVAGWATDRFFGGRRAPVIAALLFVLGLASLVFAYVDPRNTAALVAITAVVGFCTFGPHILMVGHAGQDFGGKRGAAGAAGFIDAIGYVGASLAGWGAGRLIVAKGYTFTFSVFGVAALLGAATACLIWRRGPISDTSPAAGEPPPPRS